MHFCMTILLTIMEPEACLLYRKNCENLDVDLEAIACVHSLQYSTVQSQASAEQLITTATTTTAATAAESTTAVSESWSTFCQTTHWQERSRQPRAWSSKETRDESGVLH